MATVRTSGTPPADGRLGGWEDSDDGLCIERGRLLDVLGDFGHPRPKGIVPDWLGRGWLDHQEARQTRPVRLGSDDIRPMCYCIPWKRVEERQASAAV